MNTSELEFDYVVIGGGSAGYAAARTARQQLERVAIIDGGAELAGLCILRGCMPSKTLIYTAELQHHARHAEKFGLRVRAEAPDMAAVQRRKREVIREFADYRRDQLESDRFTLLRSQAKFVDPGCVQLDDGRTVRAKHFLVATGSVVARPPIAGLDLPGIWTSDEVLDLEVLPESIIVLGGGVVACELAQFLARMGTRVTQVQRSPHILKEFSQAATETMARVFREEGIELFTDTALQAVEETAGGGFRVRFTQNGETIERSAAHVLNALGRRPNTGNLGLEAVGVQLLKSGHIKTNAFQQSSVAHIYAAGDCAGPHEIVHVAILQGETAARHASGEDPNPYREEDLVSVVFTDPQVAQAGKTAAQLRAEGIDFVQASYPFDDHGKSILMEAKAGHVAVLADRATGKVLGAEVVGKEGGELIHALAVGIALGATARDLLRTHWYHPTLSEIWSYPLEDVLDLCKA